jgi:hypothetical protein
LLPLLKLKLITGRCRRLRRCRCLEASRPRREESLPRRGGKTRQFSGCLRSGSKEWRNVFLVLRELRLIDIERVLRFLRLEVLRLLGSIRLRLPRDERTRRPDSCRCYAPYGNSGRIFLLTYYLRVN